MVEVTLVERGRWWVHRDGAYIGTVYRTLVGWCIVRADTETVNPVTYTTKQEAINAITG